MNKLPQTIGRYTIGPVETLFGLRFGVWLDDDRSPIALFDGIDSATYWANLNHAVDTGQVAA